MSEPYGVVRRGLREVVASWPSWQESPLVLLRNRLLDACGGDARPYIALVVRAAELGVPERIGEWKDSGVPWNALRGSLVVSLVSEAFLQPEMAGWVVDTWGVALIGETGLGLVTTQTSPTAVTPATSEPRRETRTNGRPRTPRAPTPRGGGTRTGASPAQSPATRSTATSPSAYPARRTTSSVPSRGSGLAARHTPLPPPSWMTPVTRVSLGVIFAGVTFLVVQVVRSGQGPENRRIAALAAAEAAAGAAAGAATADSRAAPSTDPSRVTEGAPPTPMSGVARGAMPVEANDPSRLLIVRPPTRQQGQVGPGAAVLEGQVATLATSKADRVELRSGRRITGRVEVVRASVVLFRDAESGLRYEIAKQDIREITTEFGTKVRFGAEGDPQNERQAPLVARGVGGTYRVTYTFREVRGSPECQSTAAQDIAPDVMSIDHRPGADTLNFDIVNGSHYYGVVDADGVFATALALNPEQARESSAYTSRFNGRFTPGGFEATFDLIAYRRSRVGRDITCHTTLSAIGEREGVAPRSPTVKP